MDLLSLLAKLTLDSSDYNRNLDEAQKAADNFKPPEAKPLTVDTKEFNDDIGESEDKVTVFQQLVDGAWSGIKDGLKKAGIGTLLGKLVTDLGKAVTLTAQLGDEASKGASRMQMSTKTYQELGYALEKSGGSIKNLEQGMKNFDNAIGGNATDKQKEAFKALGIEAEKATSAEELMINTLNTIADRDDADKGYLLRTLFGDKNDELFTLIENGSEGIRDLRQEANDVGRVMSDKEIENAIAYMDAIERLKNGIQDLKTDFGEMVLPVITEAVQGLTRIVAFISGLGGNKSLADIFANGDKEFAEQLLTIEGTGTAAEALADKLLGMGETSQMTAEQYAIWKGTAEELIKLVPSLGEVIDTETGQISANSEEIKENIKQWENLAKQKALQTLKEEKLQAITEKNKDLIAEQVKLNEKEAEAAAKKELAIKLANEYLQDEEQGAYRQQITGITEVNSDTFGQALKYFTSLDNDAGKAMRDYNGVANEIYGIKDNVAAATEELEKGKKEYEDWCKAADQLYGSLDSDAESATQKTQDLKKSIDSLPGRKVIELTVPRMMTHAIGSDYIPYDNYPALLHRGEKVLTATEARQTNNVDFSGLEDRIEAAIRRGMDGVSVRSYLNGRDITDEVNRQNINAVKGRRFSG